MGCSSPLFPGVFGREKGGERRGGEGVQGKLSSELWDVVASCLLLQGRREE